MEDGRPPQPLSQSPLNLKGFESCLYVCLGYTIEGCVKNPYIEKELIPAVSVWKVSMNFVIKSVLIKKLGTFSHSFYLWNNEDPKSFVRFHINTFFTLVMLGYEKLSDLTDYDKDKWNIQSIINRRIINYFMACSDKSQSGT